MKPSSGWVGAFRAGKEMVDYTAHVRRLVTATLIACVFPTALAAKDGDVLDWGTVGNWRLKVDKTYGNSCFMSSIYEGGIFLRVGFKPEGLDGPMYFMVGSESWISLKVGKRYNITLQFDNREPWSTSASVTMMGDIHWLSFEVADINFLKQFRAGTWMKVSNAGKKITALHLKDTAIATANLARCQVTVEGIKSPGGQPGPAPKFIPEQSQDERAAPPPPPRQNRQPPPFVESL